ncbi:unnamed protein product, partial [Didymodactylos carnosus]
MDCTIRLFADDATMYLSAQDRHQLVGDMNSDLIK